MWSLPQAEVLVGTGTQAASHLSELELSCLSVSTVTVKYPCRWKGKALSEIKMSFALFTNHSGFWRWCSDRSSWKPHVGHRLSSRTRPPVWCSGSWQQDSKSGKILRFVKHLKSDIVLDFSPGCTVLTMDASSGFDSLSWEETVKFVCNTAKQTDSCFDQKNPPLLCFSASRVELYIASLWFLHHKTQFITS